MPGPPVGNILTSNDPGLGTFEMKVKGTYVIMEGKKFLTSKFLFISPEEEQAFLDRNPLYEKGGFVELTDPGSVKAINSTGEDVKVPIRGRSIASEAKKQIKDKVLNQGEEIKNPLPKPKVKKS